MTERFDQAEACVEAILSRLGKRIVLGTPLGIGKPNALLNALYRRAKADPSIELDLVTALSLNPPRGKSPLEERFLAPIRERVWPDYPRLEFVDDLDARRLPDNVRVIEFYFQSGSRLRNPQAQQQYISSNYTHVARDMLSRGANLLLQAVALREDGGQRRLSLSSNPDVTLEILPMLRAQRRPWLAVGQVNRRLPWFGHDAEIAEDQFDLLLDAPELDHEPFSVPHEPVDAAAHAIGLYASSLVRDGGTLQVGIGALGDACCHGLRLRQRDPETYRAALAALGQSPLTAMIGGDRPFAEGLYVASELISNPLFTLFEDGIVRRRVYEDAAVQARVNAEGEAALDAGQRAQGIAMHGAFFIGPADFYERLRLLSDEQRALIGMTSVAEVNRIYTHFELERLQRRDARFINITMKLTLLGAAVSDQVADGQVVSGVGGQYNFVSMAHQLPDGRSVLLCRATRGSGRALESNLVWEYPHATIPRHLRDIVITEYGIADLRGKTDRECIAALLAIADSRFQEALAQQAIAAGKLPAGWRVPEAARRNLPQIIADQLQAPLASGALPKLPFGCDLSDAELALAGRLRALKSAAESWPGRLRLLRALAQPASKQRAEVAAALRHLQLDQPDAPRTLRWLVRAAYRL